MLTTRPPSQKTTSRPLFHQMSRFCPQSMPYLNDRIPVSPGQLVSVLGEPDSEQHSTEVTGVVEISPAEQNSERVQHYQALYSGVGRKRVWINLENTQTLPILSHKSSFKTSCRREAAIICHCRCDLDLLTLKVVSRVMCGVGCLSANFGLPRPLCSRLRPDEHDRQTSDRLPGLATSHV